MTKNSSRTVLRWPQVIKRRLLSMRDDKANETLSSPVPKIGPAQSVATPNKRNEDLKLRRAAHRVVPFLVAFLMAAGAYLTEMPGWQILLVAALGGVGAVVCVHFFA